MSKLSLARQAQSQHGHFCIKPQSQQLKGIMTWMQILNSSNTTPRELQANTKKRQAKRRLEQQNSDSDAPTTSYHIVRCSPCSTARCVKPDQLLGQRRWGTFGSLGSATPALKAPFGIAFAITCGTPAPLTVAL